MQGAGFEVAGRVPGYLGRVLTGDGAPVGTCFQVAPGVLVSAWHVLVDAGAAGPGDVVAVDGLAPGGAPRAPARVARVDELHDLAVLVREAPLPGTVSRLAATDGQAMRVAVVVTGHCVVVDPGRPPPRYLDANGTWAGGTTRADAVPLGRLSSQDLMTGMSGAPVRRLSDDVVVGVVSARYNSADGWLRDSVWVARTEDLVPLLADLAEVELAGAPLAGAVDLLLAVDATQVRLSGAGPGVDVDVDVRAAHGGVRPGLAGALEDVRRARARAGTLRAEPAGGPGEVTASMRRAGQLLAESFLPGPVADALAGVLRRAEAAWQPVRLGIQIDAAAAVLTQLPWEALPDPASGAPLALHQLVTVYRQVTAAAPREVPGPLRIVVAISAPASGGGAVLDYEAELRAVLAAVKGARAGDARVHIVPFATTAAIRGVLAGGDVHVLHISAHGGPGTLDLEDDAGAARPVTAQEFLTDAVPPGCMPPVIALAACYTDAPAAAQSPSFAAELLARGAAAVIGTETSVTDRYATRVFARVYAGLAHAPNPDVVAAVAQARRAVQAELATATNPRDQAIAGLDEWGVLTVLAASGSTIVYDPATTPPASAALGQPQPATRSIAGLLARDPGEFVGRRAEQRSLPAALSGGPMAGVVLHGIGGVGKTTLAAETIRRTLERDPGRVVATVTGETNLDAVLAAAVAALRRPLLMTEGTAAATALQALSVAAQMDLPWQDRLDVLREHLLDAVPLLLVLDNFEDNLVDQDQSATGSGAQRRALRDESLASLLAAWTNAPGRSRLLVTCRYPFTLPDDAGTRLQWRPLGPLTAAETLKLVWSLPHLDALEEKEIEQVRRMVGGHPRALEYLDALLARGQGRFPDITARLTKKVTAVLGDQAQAWLTTQRTLDAAIADAVTVAADDVLLADLLAGLSPDARRLLLGASIYREPVDLNALLFQVGEPDEDAAWTPDRAAAEQRILAALAEHDLDAKALNQALQTDTLNALPPDLVTAITPDLAELRAEPRPPRSTALDLPSLIDTLADTSLLTLDSESGTVVVHRWTAAEVARRSTATGGESDVTAAHQRAAAYWLWRVQAWPQDRQADVHDGLEARHHLLATNDIETANEVTEHVCAQLEQWGAWDHETALIHDTLSRLPAGHSRRPAYIHGLATLAHHQGDYSEAERRYHQALDINQRLGNQAGMANGYHQLGILAHDRGDHPEAERRYQQALDINERLGNQAGMATSYHQLGILAHTRGDYPEAESRYQQSLELKERLGNQAGMATSYHEFGILAYDRADYPEANRRYQQSLEINERLGNQAGMANNYHQLGNLAHTRGDHSEAERRYHQALDINQALGNQAGMANNYGQLGNLAHTRGDHSEAERRYQQALDIFERLGDLAGIANSDHQLGMVAHDRGDHPEAERRYQQALDIAERLGDQAGMACSWSQLGVLRVDQGRPLEAIRWHVRALATHLALQVPQASFNLDALAHIRAELGDGGFVAAVRDLLDEESTANLLALLDDHAAQSSAEHPPSACGT